MIWSPEIGEMGVVFIFAHLIMKFGYTLEYISKLNERKIKNVAFALYRYPFLKHIRSNWKNCTIKSCQWKSPKKLMS
jgi:hypothetical protein